MYAARHLTGSVNIGLHGQYALWAGTVLDRQHPIVIMAEAGREQEATLRLGRIGFDHIAGYVAGGIHALAARLELTRCTERLSPLAWLRRSPLRPPRCSSTCVPHRNGTPSILLGASTFPCSACSVSATRCQVGA
jgi:hypothetical protein